MLVVGAGAGVTAGAFVVYPEVERIVICEIEPRVLVGAREFFAEENYRVLDDPRTEVIYDDARHFLATTGETFDIITSDPIHSWMRGAAALYSSEYFELGKQHLNPGGILVQWVPLYETDEAAVKSQLATFMQAFPDGTLWNSDIFGGGYDLVVLGQLGGARISCPGWKARRSTATGACDCSTWPAWRWTNTEAIRFTAPSKSTGGTQRACSSSPGSWKPS